MSGDSPTGDEPPTSDDPPGDDSTGAADDADAAAAGDADAAAAPDEPSEASASSHGASGGPIEPVLEPATDRHLWIPADATDDEAAAMAAAIGAYLSDRERADTEEDTWDGDRWAFAGRLEATRGRAERVPSSTPRDPWTASGRADRF